MPYRHRRGENLRGEAGGLHIGQVLELVDEDPEAMAFLSDSARALWPKAGPTVHQKTMIALARSLMSAAPDRKEPSPSSLA
jgi:hypothetical protein